MAQGSDHQQYLGRIPSPYCGSVCSYRPSDQQLLASDFQMLAQPPALVEECSTVLILLYSGLKPVLLKVEAET